MKKETISWEDFEKIDFRVGNKSRTQSKEEKNNSSTKIKYIQK